MSTRQHARADDATACGHPEAAMKDRLSTLLEQSQEATGTMFRAAARAEDEIKKGRIALANEIMAQAAAEVADASGPERMR